jgi:hypothetical protein
MAPIIICSLRNKNQVGSETGIKMSVISAGRIFQTGFTYVVMVNILIYFLF